LRSGARCSWPVRRAAEALHVRHHSAVELAQRAQTAGLIRRERDPCDQRRMHLELTARGRRQLEVLTRAHLPRIEALAKILDQVLQSPGAPSQS
jgi:DNA-binding MarR family transcriptional regulator